MKHKILLGVAIVIVLCLVIALPIVLTRKSPELVQDPECRPMILAHRGASGYVPEHTLGAYALAITLGADYVEPDLVMTKDGHMIARHDNQLDLTTDVSQRPEFAARRRTQIVDGSNITGWFSEDFTLDEVKTLRAVERIPNIRPGNARMDAAFDVPTLQEIIELVKAMERNEGRIIGIYPEIKHGVHFQRLSLPMEKPLVDELHENGYVGKNARAFIQSFEVSNLIQLRELTDLRLIQLFSSNPSLSPYDQYLLGTELTYGQMATAEGLKTIATYADAVGPDKSYIIPRTPDNRLGNATDFVENAHAVGLLVHPYTFRSENLYLPEEYRSGSADMLALGDARGEMSAFLATGIDGLFADQPDVAVSLREPCYT